MDVYRKMRIFYMGHTILMDQYSTTESRGTRLHVLKRWVLDNYPCMLYIQQEFNDKP